MCIVTGNKVKLYVPLSLVAIVMFCIIAGVAYYIYYKKYKTKGKHIASYKYVM